MKRMNPVGLGIFHITGGVICPSFFAKVCQVTDRWGIVEVFVAERLTKSIGAFSEKMMMGIIEFLKRGYAHYRIYIYIWG